MDFHSLSRRELQALCKMNKIPANITNLAMADALQALETVDGLEEMMAQSEAGYLETPAKSMTAARSVSRTSNRPKTLKEEPDSKLTTKSRRGTRKVDGETDAAPQSACPRVPMAAQSVRTNVESSTDARAYNTRRSTRLLEKQMCELSLKDSEDVVDSNADKDSQDLQRQFIQDIDNSLAPDNKAFSDVCNVTKEATEELKIENMDVLLEDGKSFPNGVESVEPVSTDDSCDVENAFNDENMDVLLEDEKSFPNGVESVEPVCKVHTCDVENAFNDVEVSMNDKELKNDEDQPMQEDVAEEMEMVSHPSLSIKGNTDTEEATQDVEETIESKADSTADHDENSADPAMYPQTDDEYPSVDSDDVKQVDSQINLELSSALIASANGVENEAVHMNAIQMKAPEAAEDEFGFLSESDDDIDENENALPVDSVLAGDETEEELCDETEEAGDETEEELCDETEEAGDETEEESGDETEEESVDGTEEESSDELAEEESSDEVKSKSPLKARSPLMPASVGRVPVSDNIENLQKMSAPKPVSASPAPGTRLEDKSLRQLKKMIRGLYKQPQQVEATQKPAPQKPAPLQLHAENVK